MDNSDDSYNFRQDYDFLVNVSEIDSESLDHFVIISRFLDKYVSKLYGKRHIKTWLKRNKGHAFLDMVTSSDISYCLLILENQMEV